MVLGLSEIAIKATPFIGQFYQFNGQPVTNVCTMTAFPSGNAWTVYGTNLVFGNVTITNTPNASGLFTNWAYPNLYRLQFAGITGSLYVQLPDTTNWMNLALCVTNAPTVGGTPLNSYGTITNWLGFPPATNTYSGITAALGFLPATNTAPVTNTLIYVSGVSAITNASGVVTNLNLTYTTNTLIYVP